MKFFPIFVLILVSAAGVIAAPPLSHDTTEIYLTTGGAFPTSDFNLRYNFGFNGSVGFGFTIWKGLRIVPKFEVQNFSLDHRAFLDSVSGGAYTAILTGADIRFFKDIPRWPVDPLVVVGGGIAVASVSQLNIGSVFFQPYTDTKFYLNFGAGFDIRITPNLSAFALARYVRMSSGYSRDEFYPLSVGIRLPL